MIRIITKFNNCRVATIYSFSIQKWCTISYMLDKVFSTEDSDNLFDAGQNHIRLSLYLRDKCSVSI